MNRHILLAYGEKEFTKRLKSVLEQQGHTTTVLWEGDPPRARYDLIIQLARDPAHLAEGTRLLLEKAKKDHSRLILLIYRLDEKLYEEAARFAQTLVEEAARRNESETVILNLGRIYGPGISARDSGALGHLVTEFTEGNVLTLYGEGKDRDYYLFTADALEGIALAVERAESGGTYSLAPSVAIDSETAAKLLYELGGGRHEINFHRGLSAAAEKGEIPGKPLSEFKIKTPFHEGILTILKSAPPAPRARAEIRLPHLRLPLIHWKRPQFSRKSLLSAGIVLLLLSPLLYLGGSAGFAFYHFTRFKAAVQELDFGRAQTSAAAAAVGLDQLGRLFPIAHSLAEASRTAAELAGEGSVVTMTLENLLKSRRGEALTPQSTEDFRNLAAAFSSAEERLTFAWLEAESAAPKFLQGFSEKVLTAIEESLPIVRFGNAFAQEAEELLGYKGERSYLLLFQNSAELQPGGGRMGTFAQLTLVNGGIKDLKFFNESDFKHISSPLGRFSSISKLPDFADGARAIADIFLRGDGKQTQGVVGVDLHFAQELLEITGPLILVDFNNQEVTAENFFEVTTREVETDFFPGTTKKKRFIQALGESVLDKFFSADREKYGQVFRLVWENLKSKGILLYFTNPTAYLTALENNFAGRIREADGDFLYPYDHNAGSKGTVWVKRSINYRVYNTNREGGMRAELKITWKNEGTEAWPGGNYLNKTAVLVPQGSKLIEARRGEKNVFSSFSAGTFKRRTLFSTPYKISTYITVAPQSEQTLTLIYDLPKKLNLKNLTSYHLLVQKQPGTVADEFRFVFETPLGWEAVSDNLQKVDNRLIFEGSLEKDLELEIGLKEE